ncbi:hypothetical protein [Pseudomonas viridiflava]|uniref:hypothetical protein n=1 Tax=Pseudomonas viridiflava TaxID=33069 RepID=UPI0020BF1C38|nr:hypothetical protein [Pseudomonas viridiflava]
MTTAQQPLQQNLPPPVVAALLPDDPQWDERDLLPTSAALVPLPVNVPAWVHIPISGLETIVRLYWVTGLTQHLVEERKWDSDQYPVIPVDQLLFEVPVILLVQGLHEVWYELVTPNGDINASDGQPVSIDLTPPVIGVVSPLVFDTDTITEQYLFDNGGQAVAQVPVYNDFKPGDVIVWYWSSSQSQVLPSDEVGRRTLLRGESQPLSLAFPGEEIVRRGDGDRFAFYRLRDRAGNLSPYSHAFELEVKAQPAPRVLPPPRVTQATGSAATSTLNPIHAIHGATVTIPDDAVIRAGETVSVQWAEPESVGSYLTSKEDARAFTIPSTCIAQHFGKSIPVYYEVHESGVADPHVSNTHTLKVSTISGFPVVQCDKVSGGRLSLGSIADGGRALFTLGSWPFMDTSQFINIQVIGLSVGGQNLTIDVLKESSVPHVADTIDVGHITKTDLQRFKTGGLLEVRTKVSFDEKVSWLPFGSLRPTLSN